MFFLFSIAAGQKVVHLALEVSETKKQAYAQGTLDNLQGIKDRYWKFCIESRIQPFPASHVHLAFFGQYLADAGLKPSTIKNYLSGVRTLHRMWNLPEPGFNAGLDLFLRGLDRRYATRPARAKPILPSLLLCMVKLLDLNNAFQATLHCLLIFAFFGLLRKSNLTPNTCKQFDPKKQLLRGDIFCFDNKILVSIKWSKTIQCAERDYFIPMHGIPSSRLCPVSSFLNMKRVNPQLLSSPAFCNLDGSPITYRQYNLAIKLLVQGCRLNPHGYSTHSLRRGGATWAAMCGVDTKLIKSLGDWKSDCFHDYIDFPVTARSRAFHLMAYPLTHR